LLHTLFPSTEITIDSTTVKIRLDRLISQSDIVLHSTKIDVFTYCKSIIDQPYIVFHTKFRENSSKMSLEFQKNKLPILCDYWSRFKTKYLIIIIGDRKIEQNYEAQYHKVISLYEQLLLLKNNNKVLDLTEEFLYSGQDNDGFLRDVGIIKDADVNITFGLGGNFCLSKFLSKKMIGFTYKTELNPKLLTDVDTDFITSDFNEFLSWHSDWENY